MIKGQFYYNDKKIRYKMRMCETDIDFETILIEILYKTRSFQLVSNYIEVDSCNVCKHKENKTEFINKWNNKSCSELVDLCEVLIKKQLDNINKATRQRSFEINTINSFNKK